MSDETKRVHFHLDADVHEHLSEQFDHGGMSEFFREAAKAYAHGTVARDPELAAVQLAIEREQEKLDDARSERDRAERAVDHHTSRLDVLRERQQLLTETQSDYETLLDQLEESVRSGGSIFPTHGRVKDAADAGGVSPHVVIADVQKRVGDDADPEQFEDSYEGWG